MWDNNRLRVLPQRPRRTTSGPRGLTPSGGCPTLPGMETRQVSAYAMTASTYEAMADFIVVNPTVSNRDLAIKFGYSSAATISRIRNTDAFRALLATRRAEVVDPTLKERVEEMLQMGSALALESLMERIGDVALPMADDSLIRATDVLTRAAGYGAKSGTGGGGVVVNISVPPKAADYSEWRGGITLDGDEPKGPGG